MDQVVAGRQTSKGRSLVTPALVHLQSERAPLIRHAISTSAHSRGSDVSPQICQLHLKRPGSIVTRTAAQGFLPKHLSAVWAPRPHLFSRLAGAGPQFVPAR